MVCRTHLAEMAFSLCLRCKNDTFSSAVQSVRLLSSQLVFNYSTGSKDPVCKYLSSAMTLLLRCCCFSSAGVRSSQEGGSWVSFLQTVTLGVMSFIPFLCQCKVCVWSSDRGDFSLRFTNWDLHTALLSHTRLSSHHNRCQLSL